MNTIQSVRTNADSAGQLKLTAIGIHDMEVDRHYNVFVYARHDPDGAVRIDPDVLQRLIIKLGINPMHRRAIR